MAASDPEGEIDADVQLSADGIGRRHSTARVVADRAMTVGVPVIWRISS